MNNQRHKNTGLGSIVYFLLVSLLCTFLGSTAYSQQYRFKDREASIVHSALQIKQHNGFPDTLTVKHDKWDEIAALGGSWSDRLKYKVLHSSVRFSVDYASPYLVTQPYTYKLTYMLQGYGNPLDTTSYSVHYDTLVISYKPDSLAAYQNLQIKRYNGYHKIRIVLTGLYEINGAGGTPVAVDMSSTGGFVNFNFNVEGAITVQPYHKKVQAANSSLVNVYGSSAPNLQSGHDAPVHDYLPVRWNIPGNSLNDNLELTPANYELEWTYVDNYHVNSSTGVVTERSAASLDYDFKHNSTRVTVDSNYYQIPLIYQKGYLVYRVRMVRPDSVYYRYPIYGNWNLAESGTVSSVSSANYYQISNAHSQDSLNWQYTISFAEQGKYKHVLSYYDGMLKNRQSITRFNSQPGKLIATEQIYDYEGRPSISILPTPVNSNDFSYQYNLSLNQQTGAPYAAPDFDSIDYATVCPGETVIPRLDDNALAHQYYSPANPNQQGFQKFVPDAGGYPLVQTIYSPGFEDRVDKQGGAGDSLQIGYHHYTKNYYVGGDQMDLNRLFGLNVGLSGFYRKTVSQDPNGQLSLNYTDYKGHTVASSLVGIPDTTKLALTRNTNVPDTSSFTEDHLAGMNQQIIGNSRIFEKVYFNDVDGNNMIQYLATFTPYATFCPGKYLAVRAGFDYSVADECGAPVAARSGVLGESGVLTSGQPLQYADSPAYVFMNTGSYNIQKTMRFDEEDIAQVVDDFIAGGDNCMRTEQDFIKEEVLSKEYPCAPEMNDCDFLRQQMKDELWPNYHNNYVVRKYGYYTDSTGTIAGNDNSIFTMVPYHTETLSYLDDGGNLVTYDTTYYHYRYQDTCLVQLPDTIVRFGQVYTNLQALPVDTFIALFNDSIAEALLPLHPEYCNLQNCTPDTFAQMLRNLPDAQLAEVLGLLHLSDIIQSDPLYANLPASFVSPMDSLSYFGYSGLSIDSMAIVKAYCDCGDSVLFNRCREDIFAGQIAGNLLNSDYTKEQYFKTMLGLYLSNRTRFLQYLNPNYAAIDCERCQDVRMELIPPPIFPTPITVNPPGSGNVFGVNTSSLNQLSSSNPNFGTQFQNLLDSLGNNYDSAYQSAQTIYNNANDLLNAATVNNIMKDLQNCADSASLIPVRNYLLGLCSSGVVSRGHFKPEHIRAALQAGSIAMTDLCHPYLINYDYFNQINEFEFSCKPRTYYESMTTALNSGNYINALTHPGVSYSATLSSSNGFEQALISRLGTASAQLKCSYSAAQNLYTLEVYVSNPADASTVRFYFRGDDLPGSCTAPFQLSAGESLALEAGCINDYPPFANGAVMNHIKGYIGRYTFWIKAVKTNGSSSTDCPVLSWNNQIDMNESGVSNIAECIPCNEMYRLHQEFMDTMNLYDMHEVDHPYYEKALKNFMNYSLKRTYAPDDYTTFIQSCALADSLPMPLQDAYASVGFNDTASVHLFMEGLHQVDTSAALWPLVRYRYTTINGPFERVLIDLKSLPEKNWRLYKEYIDGFTTGIGNKRLNTPFLTVISNLMSYILIPDVQLSAAMKAAITSATGLTVTFAGNVYVHNGSTYTLYSSNYIYLPSGMSTKEIGHKLDWVQQYLQEQQVPAVMFNRYGASVNDQYTMTEKVAYLNRVKSLPAASRTEILDSLEPAPLVAGVPEFQNLVLSYGTYTRPGAVSNLYMVDPATVTDGTHYSVLQTILNSVKTYLGGNKLFFAGNNTRHVLSGSQLVAYRCGDQSYWYRYFGVNDTLYNVYLKPPAFLAIEDLADYTLSSVEVVPGEGQSNAFKLVMFNPLAPAPYVTVKAYTDFVIGNNKKLDNVLLAHPLTSDEEEDLMNCERIKLEEAVYAGKIRYRHYRDSVRSQLIGDFTDYVLHNGVTEELRTSYKTQRFNYTLYEYDRAQNLIRTIPPAGVHYLAVNLLSQVNTERENMGTALQYLPEHQKGSHYYYNSLNQVTEQRTPDGGRTEFFYDAAGRLIFSQNAEQRESGRMTYTLYDEQSRIVETGQARISCSPYFAPLPSSSIPAGYSCAYLVDGMLTPFPPQVANLKAYDNNTIVSYVRALAREEVVLTRYDEADINLSAQAGMSAQDNLRKRVASIKYFNNLAASASDTGGYDYAMHFSYDIAGNVKTLTRDYPSWAGAGQRFKRVDYDYDLISGKVNMLSYNRGFADQYYQRYHYDADNRITSVATSSDGIIWNRDAAYEYYDHGPLARMSLGEQRVQGVDYAYTIQGWLKAVNGDILSPEKDMGEDAMGNSVHGRDAVAMSIDYFKGDYRPIGDTIVTFAGSVGKNLYNGNIPRTSTAIKPFETLNASYTYDQLNRLIRADYAELAEDGTETPTQRYRNGYSYDADGNLQQLTRNGNNTSLLQMDSLVYRYTVGNTDNRLQNVNDYAADNYSNDIKYNALTNVSRYLYDHTGNLVKDLVGGQDTIQWSHYNKVTRVVQDDADSTTLRFAYDGSGQRYLKTHIVTQDDTTVEQGDYYVRDAQGNILAVYHGHTRYEISATTVLTNVLVYAVSQTGPFTLVQQYVVPSYGANGSFQQYVLNQGAAQSSWATGQIGAHPVSYYLSHSPALYSQFLASSEQQLQLYDELAAYTRNTSTPVLAGAVTAYLLDRSSGDYDPQHMNDWAGNLFSSSASDSARRHAVSHLTTLVDPNIVSELYGRFGLYYDWSNNSNNINTLSDAIGEEQVRSDEFATSLFEQLVNPEEHHADLEQLAAGLSADAAIHNAANSSALSALATGSYQTAMVGYGYQSAFGSFADSWAAAGNVLSSGSSSTDLLGVIYSQQPDSLIYSLNNQIGNNHALLSGGILQANGGTVNLSSVLNGMSAQLLLQVPSTVYANALKAQDLYLSAHHLYGSSRLGTRDYLSGQIYSNVDFTGAQPVYDTLALTSRRPWYSLDYQEAIGGNATSPWGMADKGHMQVSHQIGQKQYELSNHLGNVQATVSDLPYQKQEMLPGTDIPVLVKEPALVSAYDYYPFGMLQPGRYVSDTSSQCLTVSRTRWITSWASYCVAQWSPQHYTVLGTATATLVSNNSLLSAQAESAGSGISLIQNVQPGKVNNVSLDIVSMAQTGDDATVIQAVEYIGGNPVVLGSLPVTSKGSYRISFTPTGSSVQLWIVGAYDMQLKPTCYTYPVTTQETYLVDICDESKDRYRFGFNGQEKDNEIAGKGNHYTALYGEADPRTARRWNQDPKPNPSISNYALYANNPIWHSDVLLDTVLKAINPKGNQGGDKVIYDAAGNQKDEANAIHIFAHGNPNVIQMYNESTGKTTNIRTAEEFDNYMTTLNIPEWQKAQKGGNITVILHSCRTGANTVNMDDYNNGNINPNSVTNNSIAQKISKAFPNISVVAPTERDYFSSKSGEMGPWRTSNTDVNGEKIHKGRLNRWIFGENEYKKTDWQGSWYIFRNGVIKQTRDANWKPTRTGTGK